MRVVFVFLGSDVEHVDMLSHRGSTDAAADENHRADHKGRLLGRSEDGRALQSFTAEEGATLSPPTQVSSLSDFRPTCDAFRVNEQRQHVF